MQRPWTIRCCNSSPLGCEQVNLTGDYLWRSSAKVGAGVQVPAAIATTLTCFIFRFLK